MHPSTEKSRTLQKTAASLSVVCTLLALAFLILTVSLLRLRDGKTAAATPSQDTILVESSASSSSVFADPLAVQTKLHTELGRYLDAMGDDRFNLSIAIETGDGSVTYFFNCDKEQEAASLYKLPLAMLLCDQIDEGKLKEDALIDFNASALRDEGWNPIASVYAPGSQVPLNEAIASMLTHSDNIAAAILYEYLGGWEEFASEQLAYSSKAVKPQEPLDNVVNAWQVMDELRLLQASPEKYELITESLDEAADDAYLNEFIDADSMIQKYGQIDANTNAAGYSKTGVPYRIAVLSASAQCQLDPGQVNEIVWNIFNTAVLADDASIEKASVSSAASFQRAD